MLRFRARGETLWERYVHIHTYTSRRWNLSTGRCNGNNEVVLVAVVDTCRRRRCLARHSLFVELGPGMAEVVRYSRGKKKKGKGRVTHTTTAMARSEFLNWALGHGGRDPTRSIVPRCQPFLSRIPARWSCTFSWQSTTGLIWRGHSCRRQPWNSLFDVAFGY